MIPIRDHNPSGRTPYVTYALIAANVGVFILFNLMLDEELLNQLFFAFGMVPLRISYGVDLYTLVSSQFLHGGLLHIAGNMLFLWLFGDNMEDRMGHVRFLLFYLASGILAALAEWAMFPASEIPTIGASGAIAGVMGGYLLLFPRAKVDILLILIVFFRVFAVPAWLMLGLWFVTQLGNGFAAGYDAEGDGVAYWAHAGGFIAGVILSLPLFLRLGGIKFWQLTDGKPPHPEARYTLSRSSIPTVRRR